MIQRALHWLQRRRHTAEQQRLLAGGPALKTLLFHALYDDTTGPCPSGLDPSLVCSLSWVEKCLIETQQQGFRFIHPSDLPQALSSRDRLALLTLDDGYANNRLLLPLLHRLHIPALLFVTTDAMQRQHSYWWDVLARESVNDPQLSEKRRALKKLTAAQIEQQLLHDFGPACFTPQGDHDRPMTANELRAFASDPLITLGNHTHRHVLLDQLPFDDALSELFECGRILRDVVGHDLVTLAYPNGRWGTSTLDAATEAGIQFAFTTERVLAPLPLKPDRHLRIPRHQPMPA